MNGDLDPSERFITPNDGVKLFIQQTWLFPELNESLLHLSSGKLGVVQAIIERMGDAISEDPMQETTVSRVREVLGVPDDPSELPDWQSAFWDSFRQEKQDRWSNAEQETEEVER